MDISVGLPTFIITLREGVEAALVVGIVLACLKKAKQSQLNIWVYAAVIVGIILSSIVGLILSFFIQNLGASSQQYGPVIEPLMEGIFSLVAIFMLSWMLLWMTQQSRQIKSQVEGAVNNALKISKKAGWGVFSLILIAVLREGFETILFVIAKLQQGIIPALGAITGLASSAVIGIALFKWGIKLNLRLFFQIMGVLLLLIVAGLVVSTLESFDTAINTLANIDRQSASLCIYYQRFAREHSCILGPMVWNTSKILPDDVFPGIILKTLFGYSAKLYQLQAIAYVLFLTSIGGIYFQSLAGRVFFLPKQKPGNMA